jgi:hypothetical protein
MSFSYSDLVAAVPKVGTLPDPFQLPSSEDPRERFIAPDFSFNDNQTNALASPV